MVLVVALIDLSSKTRLKILACALCVFAAAATVNTMIYTRLETLRAFYLENRTKAAWQEYWEASETFNGPYGLLLDILYLGSLVASLVMIYSLAPKVIVYERGILL